MAERQQTSLTPDAHKALTAAAALASGIREKRVTMSAALVAMTELARRHRDEFGKILVEAEAG